jgi:hypothetical protein
MSSVKRCADARKQSSEASDSYRDIVTLGPTYIVSCVYTRRLTESIVPQLMLTNQELGNDKLPFA